MNKNNLNISRSKCGKNKRKRSSAADLPGDDQHCYDEYDNNSDSGPSSRSTRTNLRHRSGATTAGSALKSKSDVAKRRCHRKSVKSAKKITHNEYEEDDKNEDEEPIEETYEDLAKGDSVSPTVGSIDEEYRISDRGLPYSHDDDEEAFEDVNRKRFSHLGNLRINENNNGNVEVLTQSDTSNDECENSELIDEKVKNVPVKTLLTDENGYIGNPLENCNSVERLRSDSKVEDSGLQNLQENSHILQPSREVDTANNDDLSLANSAILDNITDSRSGTWKNDMLSKPQQGDTKPTMANHNLPIFNEKEEDERKECGCTFDSERGKSSKEVTSLNKFPSVSNSNSKSNLNSDSELEKSNFEKKGCAINNLVNIDSNESRKEKHHITEIMHSYPYNRVESENVVDTSLANEAVMTNPLDKDIKFSENQCHQHMSMQIEDVDLVRELKRKTETIEDLTQSKQTAMPETIQQGHTRSFDDNSTNLILDDVNNGKSTTTTTTVVPTSSIGSTVASAISPNYHSITDGLYSQQMQMPNPHYDHHQQIFYEQQRQMQQNGDLQNCNKDTIQHQQLQQQSQQEQQQPQQELQQQQLQENQDLQNHHQLQHMLSQQMPPQSHQLYQQEQLFPYHQHHLVPPQQHLQPQQNHSVEPPMEHQFSMQNEMQPQFHLQHNQQQQHQIDQNNHMMAYFHHQHHEQQQPPLSEHNHMHHQQAHQHHNEVNLHHVYNQQENSLYRESPQRAIHQQQGQLHQQLLNPDRMNVSPKCANPIPKTIDDLMVDEFHDDVVHMPLRYKLGVSPANVKTETQDDGYETSAGDVLTPNSHSSSTNSITPLHTHQIQNPVSLMPSRLAKCDESHHQKRVMDGGLHNAKQQQSHHMQHGDSQLPQRQQQPHEVQLLERTDLCDQRLDGKDEMKESQISAQLKSEISDNDNTVSNNNSYPFLTSGGINVGSKMTSLASSPIAQQQVPNFINSLAGSSVETNGDSLSMLKTYPESPSDSPILLKPPQKRRGRKKKVLPEEGSEVGIPGVVPMLVNADNGCNRADLRSIEGAGNNVLKLKERKKHDRFNGMSEEEVIKRTLPDHLCENLDIVIVGINPGLFAAYKGHHYAGPGNHFWKCLYLSGLTQEQMNADEDYKLLKSGIGFTNMVQRATKGSADLTRKEIKEGSRVLLEKLQRFRPKIAVFNGKLIFEVFSGKKDFNFGRQPEYVEGTNTYIWVMPSSSARCAQLPRAADKVPFYEALKKFRDYLNGLISHMDESECIFTEQKIKLCCAEQENMKSLSEKQHLTINRDEDGISNTALHSAEVHPNSQSVHSDMMNQSKTQFSQFPNRQDEYMFSSGNNSYMGNSTELETMPTENAGTSNATEHECPVAAAMNPSFQQIPGKKKRGRPKKVKDKDVFDSFVGPKMQGAGQSNPNSQLGTEFNNILNLSMMTGDMGVTESPKKKRGRPKKVKPPSDLLVLPMNSVISPQKHLPHSMSIQALTSNHQNVDTPSLHHQSVYGTPPPTIHQNLYRTPKNSPVPSPSLNCTFGLTGTPPSVASCTPPRHQQQPHNHHQHQQLSQQAGMNSPHDSVSSRQNKKFDDNGSCDNYFPHKVSNSTRNVESHLNGSSSSPRDSPHICGSKIANSSSDMQNQQSTNIAYNSPSHNTDQQQQRQEQQQQQSTSDHLNQWLSAQISHQEESHRISHDMVRHDPPLSTYAEHHMHHQHNINDLRNQDNNSSHALWNQERANYENMVNRYSFMSVPQNQTQLHQLNMNTPHHTGESVHTSTPIEQHNTIDVASKSLSGLESLVDQIPTVADSEENVVETSLEGDSQRNELYGRVQDISNEMNTTDVNETPETQANIKMAGRSSDSTENSGLYSENSQISLSIQRLQHSKSSLVASPVQNVAQQQEEFANDVSNNVSMLSEYNSNMNDVAAKSKFVVQTTVGNESSPTVSANMYTHRSFSNASHSNFSVLNLAASSATSQQTNNSDNYISSTSLSISGSPTPNIHNCTPYHRHHSNLIAAAALAAVAANSSPSREQQQEQQHHQMRHSQMYIDPHSHGHHLAPHIPVNSTMYPTAGQSSGHQHSHHHHNTHAQHPTYAGSVNEYSLSSPFGSGSPVCPNSNGMHMLHMPSPNYPYGYSVGPAPPSQNSYTANSIHSSHQTGTVTACHPSPDMSAAAAAATVVSYHHPHPQHHTSPHHPHHLSMFDRIKPPNNISGYSAF